jgi:hypothetical protein
MTKQRCDRRSGLFRVHAVIAALTAAVVILTGGCATGRPAAPEPEAPPAATVAQDLADQWGIEVVALRLIGATYMLDFRYRVLDEAKAAELFERANTPILIHKPTGAKLEVPRPAKTGPLRPTNPPEAGRTYFILFSNPGMVKPGDEVTVKIGDFEADLVVE